jgi:hypothetical protein
MPPDELNAGADGVIEIAATRGGVVVTTRGFVPAHLLRQTTRGFLAARTRTFMRTPRGRRRVRRRSVASRCASRRGPPSDEPSRDLDRSRRGRGAELLAVVGAPNAMDTRSPRRKANSPGGAR